MPHPGRSADVSAEIHTRDEPAACRLSPATDLLPTDAGQLLAAIVASSDDAILSKDLRGVITSWNAGAERIYGYRPAEILGRQVSVLVPPEVENDVPELMERLRCGERIDHYETVRMARDGRRIHVSLSISPLRDEAGALIGASTIARDITGLKLEASRWRLLSHVGQALTSVLDPEELLRELAQLAVEELADYCVTYLLHDDGIRRVGAAHADPAGEDLVRRLVAVAPPRLDDETGAGLVIRTGEPTVAQEITREMIERAATGPEHLETLLQLGPLSSMVLPLRARGRTVGAIALAATPRSNRRYDDADLLLGREVAERAGLALDNARLYGELRCELRRREVAEESIRQRYSQLQVLYEMTDAVARAGRLQEIYEQALDGLDRALGVQRASILLFDSAGTMRFEAWRGISDDYRRTVEGHSPWAADARDPEPIVIPDVLNDDSLEDDLRAVILNEGIRAMAFVPLVFGGRLLGKFMLYSDRPGRLAEDELDLARTVARTIAFSITRFRDELSVREARDAAERANGAKSQFLGIMSHELRTPLNAVLGYSELLVAETKGPVNADQREQLERIQISARHQLELVEELLTYTRLEAGRDEARLMETDLRRVVHDVMELVRPQAEAKGLALEVSTPEAPLLVVTDPAKLRQILLNLAGNATKYTERGTVSICVARTGPRVVAEVRDTGPGIPADKLEYIFEPFARVDESLTRQTPGTGLGLAIARHLALLLGADLQVRSETGRGSTFTLELPLPVPLPIQESAPALEIWGA
jgi:PAS domain S-box-containing protein